MNDLKVEPMARKREGMQPVTSAIAPRQFSTRSGDKLDADVGV